MIIGPDDIRTITNLNTSLSILMKGHYVTILITHNTIASTFTPLFDHLSIYYYLAIRIHEPYNIEDITAFTANTPCFMVTTMITLYIWILMFSYN